MIYLLFIPIILQAAAMLFDEFYYHHKRGLPKWEKIGHPLDTLSVIACFSMTAFTNFNTDNLAIFLGLSVFSSLLITKDEFVHTELCEPAETWLHSILFVLHPILLLSMGTCWYLASLNISEWPLIFLNSQQINPAFLQSFLKIQLFSIIIILIYQIIYWNFYDKRPTIETTIKSK